MQWAFSCLSDSQQLALDLKRFSCELWSRLLVFPVIGPLVVVPFVNPYINAL